MFPYWASFPIGEKALYEIIGVVEDGKYDSLTESPKPAMFFPVAQYADSDLTLIVRSALPAAEGARMLRGTLANMDPNLPFTIGSWPDALTVVYFPARIATASLGVMGVLAAMLAVTGVFGMAAYSIAKRWKELGIRVSLGAQRARLMRSALSRPLAILVVGSGAGLLARRVGQPAAGADCLSSYASRPAGALRGHGDHEPAGVSRDLDSGAASAGG